MKVRHKAAASAVLGGISVVGILLVPQVAFAHSDIQAANRSRRHPIPGRHGEPGF
ncbi:hypothetical protein [Saccharopolyspora spinosa]|uniref:hypothetical protein n=1 Tax=Saccharopolyspora spinosa TaxID=60894 RepID=UPI0002379DA7|nr:hypothetical protein [Saccharopolyspora spinosa]